MMKRSIIIILGLLLFGCGDKALFTELATNRVKVIVKATYESNNPRPWVYSFPIDDSVNDCLYPAEDADPTRFMLDLAEMRISDGKHTQQFANYRKTYSAGLDEGAFLFNGTGHEYKNDDMRPDYTWRYLKVYIRKMLFDSAKKYSYDDNDINDNLGDWAFSENNEDIFAEEDVEGLNFNLYQINSYYDSLLYESGSINRIFPLRVLIDDPFIFNNEKPETVLELRMVVKNFIEMYELDYISDDVRHVKHFYALSDWLRDVKPGRVYNDIYGKYVNDCERMGRNIIAVARSYVPGETVTITGNAGALNCYVAAITESHDITEYELATSARVRPATDEPKTPILDLPRDVESVLDYYISVEKFKEDYDNFIDVVQYYEDEETGQYDEEWTAYEEGIEDFKIPGLVTWSETGAFTLTNVPVGHTYRIYRSKSFGAAEINELPDEWASGYIGTLTVSEEQAGESLSVK